MNQNLVKICPAKHILPVEGKKPITLIANDTILSSFDDKVFEQAQNVMTGKGVDRLVILPDSHAGYGVPVGSALSTDGYIYCGPVGPDICCSMSLLQTDIPEEAVKDKSIRRAIINAISERIPTGAGSRQAPKARKFSEELIETITLFGAKHFETLNEFGINPDWANKLEQKNYGTPILMAGHWNKFYNDSIEKKLSQIGSYGGGNHFGEAQITRVAQGQEEIANVFGLKNGCVSFLSHCGSRGFGFQLAKRNFESLEKYFEKWGIPFPGGDKELVYAPEDSPEGQFYLNDMALGANFAIINHLLINKYVLEAFQEVLPGTKGELVYHISHNIGRKEIIDGQPKWVFRKGSTRAWPAGHHGLKDTPFYETGHPILLPGNPEGGSKVMVALEGAKDTLYSINHGAGRCMGRKEAKRRLTQEYVNKKMDENDILFNGRNYPIDEAPDAYKDFGQVCASVEEAGLAKTVADLEAIFVIKDSDQDPEGKA